jgi:protein-L-isoaspartate(D-aspartate) O-methyltransferase
MDMPILDTADARKRMVDSQIRPNKVNDEPLLEAFRTLKRELFVPAALADFAYIDEDVPLGNGRVLLEPMIEARLLQAAAVQPHEKILVVGSGTGYGAAILHMLHTHVVALEDDPALRAIAARVLPAEIKQIAGPLALGAAEHGPYDVILIEGGVRQLPPGLALQLAPTGRIVTVIVPEEGAGTAVRCDNGAGALAMTKLFDCQTPCLPSLLPKTGFLFD